MSLEEPCAVCKVVKHLGHMHLSNSKVGNVCKDCWNKATKKEKQELKKNYRIIIIYIDFI